MRSEVTTSVVARRFAVGANLTAVGLLALTNFAGGCIPKRTCEFTRTCSPEKPDAASQDASASSTSLAISSTSAGSDDSVAIVDAAILSDADAKPSPAIECTRSTNCTIELPFCLDTANVCTACRDNNDCKSADASLCLLDDAAPQNNRCVTCLTSADCDAEVCLDNTCVACNPETNEGCNGATPVCAAIEDAPTCVGCEADEDCASTPETPTCSGHVCKTCSAEDPTHCAPETPVCVESETSARCVACTESADCQRPEDGGSTDAVCIQEQCTTCILGTNEGCPTTKPFCAAIVPEGEDAGVSYFAPNPSATPTANQYLDYEHLCVECFDDQACAGGSLPGCFAGNCVQCTEDAHCDTAVASVCDTSTHLCVGCQAVGECSHQAKACDIENRLCVECTAAEDSCGDKACQTVPGADQYTCSAANKGQTSPCFSCVGDSACLAGSNCVRDTYEDADGGWRCLWRETELDDGNVCADLDVFGAPVATTSIDGVSGPYCHPKLTSCQGYRDYGVGPVTGENGQATCLTHDDCGLPGVDDGFCVSVSVNANRCTYRCVSDLDCDAPLECGTTTGVDNTDAKVCLL